MPVAQICRRIFCQTIQIEKTRVASLPTEFVKVDGIDASICAAKTLAVHPAVLSKNYPSAVKGSALLLSGTDKKLFTKILRSLKDWRFIPVIPPKTKKYTLPAAKSKSLGAASSISLQQAYIPGKR